MSPARQLRDAAQTVVESLNIHDLSQLSKPAAQALWQLTCAVDHYDRHAHAATLPPTPEFPSFPPSTP